MRTRRVVMSVVLYIPQQLELALATGHPVYFVPQGSTRRILVDANTPGGDVGCSVYSSTA